MKFILLDIDGCLINMESRWEKLKTQQITWDQYNSWAVMSQDKVIPQGKALYSTLLKSTDQECVFVTAREEQQRANTYMQLKTHLDFRGRLLMRKDGDPYVPTTKLEILERCRIEPEDVAFAIDDDINMVQAYRSLGICAYLAPGV